MGELEPWGDCEHYVPDRMEDSRCVILVGDFLLQKHLLPEVGNQSKFKKPQFLRFT